LYLLVNYDTQQFQLAPVVAENDLGSDIQAVDASSSSNCPASHGVSGGDIGVIVVGSILAIILLLVLLLWVTKGRRFLHEMKAQRTTDPQKEVPPPTNNDEALAISNLKDKFEQLEGRLDRFENSGMTRSELVGSHDQESATAGRHSSVVSSNGEACALTIDETQELDTPGSPRFKHFSRPRFGSH
jgi:hypothetical protein